MQGFWVLCIPIIWSCLYFQLAVVPYMSILGFTAPETLPPSLNPSPNLILTNSRAAALDSLGGGLCISVEDTPMRGEFKTTPSWRGLGVGQCSSKRSEESNLLQK